MSMVINTNTASLIAQQAQAKTGAAMDTAMERLSTGKKINSASDDAAGMAMVMRMESQIKGLSMAMKNAGDAQSLVNTAEGAMDEITNILQRMRELAIQSSTDTNVASDRNNLNKEIQHLTAEIDRISSQTSWNGSNLLDGSYTAKQFQIGPEAGQTIAVSISNLASASLGATTTEGVGAITTAAATSVSASYDSDASYVLTGPQGTKTISAVDDQSAKDLAALFNAETASTGVSATAVTIAEISGLQFGGNAGANTTISFELNDEAISASNVTAADYRSIVDAVNAKSASTGVTASLKVGVNNVMFLTDADGDDIKFENFDTGVDHDDTQFNLRTVKSDLTTTSVASVVINETGSAQVGDLHSAVMSGSVTLTANSTFSISGGAAGAADAFVNPSIATNTLSTVSVTTATNASDAIKTIDGALSKIAETRADLGAVSNRLDYTVNNLSSVKVNMEASQSRIEDADFAVETSNLTKAQILSQAATAMLAQANASKQSVLSLLQG